LEEVALLKEVRAVASRVTSLTDRRSSCWKRRTSSTGASPVPRCVLCGGMTQTDRQKELVDAKATVLAHVQTIKEVRFDCILFTGD